MHAFYSLTARQFRLFLTFYGKLNPFDYYIIKINDNFVC